MNRGRKGNFFKLENVGDCHEDMRTITSLYALRMEFKFK